MKGKQEPMEVRFWRFVNKTDECWLWQGAKVGQGGYGNFGVDKKHHLAHRVSYELANGPIPDGMWVLHRCDNPPCVNPDHLFLGTRSDNMKDAHQKGRIDMSVVGSNRRKEMSAEWRRKHSERMKEYWKARKTA